MWGEYPNRMLKRKNPQNIELALWEFLMENSHVPYRNPHESSIYGGVDGTSPNTTYYLEN
jgi:hypothetical protein